MSLLNPAPYPAPWGHIWVSILVLVDVALEPDTNIPHLISHAEFQSLFSWMSLLNGPTSLVLIYRMEVSILVLVDVALEPMRPGSGGWRHHDEVSILVLVDVALELSSPGVIPPGSTTFQSLFSWMSLLNHEK